MFDNISNNFHARDSTQWNRIQIYGIGGENYAVELNDALGLPAAISNYTCGLCSDIQIAGENQLTFTVNQDAFNAQLFELIVESDALISQQTSTIVSV
ncbi:Oidioi.mRNA.OKI2018_I69.PAR.g10043.t1.cds [Oikopleura dioica]|uniref:Oidioi.mRNA.OKI2018_I69.PAR.g10043.t1.cds n=1 Tax=Oikopleura dioica TaxID=34765 RepID=A0ABN7RNQ7_OIKDI|nr:Oidioi.mRNA.OKI2018_I69.PAR.g10043.t1.cds [Oikopleura dioica]